MVHNDKVLDDVNALLDYNAVKDYLFMTVINAEENKNDLTTMPHTIIGDLAIVYKVMIKTTDERFCAAKVTNQLMDAYGIDVNKLHNDALISSPNMMKPEILPLETMLMGIPKDIALEEKEKEENLLRLLGFPEWKIQYLRELDDFDFNKNRSFHRNESPTEVKFFLNEPSEDCISEYTWEDVLNGINDAVVYKHLKKCDPVMQKIIVMLKNKYCVREIAEDLHMTTNAVYKRIEKFSKKCKKRG